MMKIPLDRPRPDIQWFRDVIGGEIEPARPPLVELFLDYEVVKMVAVDLLGLKWMDPGVDRASRTIYWDNFIEVHYRLGYDYVRISGGLDFPSRTIPSIDSAGPGRDRREWYSSRSCMIASWEDFEKYSWPQPESVDLWDYEYAASHIPEGMGMFVCPASGFLEIPLDVLLGYEKMAYLMYDDPSLVEAVCRRSAAIIHSFYHRLLGLPNLAGFFQGDDMGFRTSTLVSPSFLRQQILPEHRKLADLAHSNGLLYLLHSCGNLSKIMEDLISSVEIDAKHSFEDAIQPVGEFKRLYGDRVAALGGVDMDKLCRLPVSELRTYVRKIIADCLPGGRFALGSGNTVANYVPLQNYLAMVEEGLSFH